MHPVVPGGTALTQGLTEKGLPRTLLLNDLLFKALVGLSVGVHILGTTHL